MLKLGDRVSRQIEYLNPKAGRIYGTIVEVYKSIQGVGHTPHKLFAIQWDNVEDPIRGYMESGLQKEE